MRRTRRGPVMSPCQNPIDRDRVAGDPGLGAGDQTVLAEHAVDERRLARVGAADDRELQDRLVAVGVLLVVELAIDVGEERLEQVGDALAVLGGELDGVAEAERERFENALLAGAPLGLVGDEHDRRRRAAEPAGDLLVERDDPGARIEQEQRDVGLRNGGLGLLAHPAGKRGGVLVLVTGGVDDAEIEPDEVRVALAAVAGDAGGVVDERELLADEAVEERRLADVGTADDRDGGKAGHRG